MYVLIGHSASGKTTIEKELAKTGLNRIISYTSRPMRSNEKNHYDYHFITEEEFIEKQRVGFFAESTTYNSWHYGIAKEDCKDNSIVTVEPTGLRQLKKNKDLNVVAFFIKAEERERVIRMMLRGDNVMESFRRIISDQGGFNGIDAEVNYIVENKNGELQKAIFEIKNIIYS